MIAVVILLQVVLVRMWLRQVIKRGFIILLLGEGFTSFSVNIVTVLIFLVTKSEMKVSAASRFSEHMQKL